MKQDTDLTKTKPAKLSKLGKLYYSVMDKLCELDNSKKFQRPTVKIKD